MKLVSWIKHSSGTQPQAHQHDLEVERVSIGDPEGKINSKKTQKLFTNLPEEFEKYNPNKFILKSRKTVPTYNDKGTLNTIPPLDLRPFNLDVEILRRSATFDNDGQIHSFNDEPSYIRKGGRGEFLLLWHSHGVLHRANNQPPCVVTEPYSYTTYNEEGKSHSYNGTPSHINKLKSGWHFTWYKNGHLSRDNGLPAEILWKKKNFSKDLLFQSETYMVNQERHRDGNLPAVVTPESKVWYVRNLVHNTNGYAWITDINDKPSLQRWYLYGLMVSEEVFNIFKAVERESNLPSWAAFLVTLNMITMSDAKILLEDKSNGNSDLPFLWLLRSIGVTKESFLAALIKFDKIHNSRLSHINNKDSIKSNLDMFVDIATSEIAFDSLMLKDGKNSYA